MQNRTDRHAIEEIRRRLLKEGIKPGSFEIGYTERDCFFPKGNWTQRIITITGKDGGYIEMDADHAGKCPHVAAVEAYRMLTFWKE